MFAYCNDGLSFRAVDPSYAAQTGEVIFSDYATPVQLTAAFPAYAAGAAAMALAQQAGNALASGLTIMLSGTMTLPATVFPCDPTTQAKLSAVVTTILDTNGFPGGAPTFPMKDASGTWHALTPAQYKAVAAAISAFVAPLYLILDGNPLAVTTLPAASVALTV